MTDWLTVEVLAKAVGRGVRDVDVKPLGPGDNFASTTVRAKVTTDQGDVVHLIVKRPPPKGTVEGHYPIRATFDVEGRMYDMMPRMLELLRGAGRAEPPLGPRMLYRQREPDPLLVFEDISVQGFRLAARDHGLDVAHARLVLRALARWHAASSILLHEQPQLFDDMPPMCCEEHSAFVDGLLVKGLARFLRHAEDEAKWPEPLSRRTVAKLRRLQPTCYQRLLDAHRPAALGQGFNVGLHGDLWSGNLLFRYGADGQPEEVRLIDYQISNRGSPCSDLTYFFPTTSGAVRLQRAELVAEYHAELVACLTALGGDRFQRVPSLAELQAELQRRGVAEVLHLLAGAPIIMATHSIGLSFDNLVDLHSGDGPHPRDLAIDREPFRRLAKQFFQAWDDEGLLDELLAQDQYGSP